MQTVPFDKPVPGADYTGQASGPDPSTYYMANIVVDSTYPLQVFSGRFAPGGTDGTGDGTITDFDQAGNPFKNTMFNGKAYNMGAAWAVTAMRR